MSELKGLGSQDPMKSSQDIESYNLEFREDLQRQLYDMSQMTFNGSWSFCNTSNSGTKCFKGDSTSNTVSIHTSTRGLAGILKLVFIKQLCWQH